MDERVKNLDARRRNGEAFVPKRIIANVKGP